jgi:cation:H+ antiporter
MYVLSLVGGGLLGLVLLVVGGELLVNGSVRVARRLGLSELFIGLVLVGFGTSSPELVASLQASLSDAPGIALGNIVGSNMANLLFILGVTAMICPIEVSRRAIRQDAIVLGAFTTMFVAAGFLLPLSRLVGLVLVALLGFYIAWSIWLDRASSRPVDPVMVAEGSRSKVFRTDGFLLPLVAALGGLALLVAGGAMLVSAATEAARSSGVSETVIGLTIVAVGTSLPELAASVIAALRRRPEVAIGNVIGSNIYNMMGIGGVVGLVAPAPFPTDIALLYNPLMLLATLLAMVLLATDRKLVRVEGLSLVVLFCAYLFALGLLA